MRIDSQRINIFKIMENPKNKLIHTNSMYEQQINFYYVTITRKLILNSLIVNICDWSKWSETKKQQKQQPTHDR